MISEERETGKSLFPARQYLAHDLFHSEFVGRVGVRVEQTDGEGLDAAVDQLDDPRPDFVGVGGPELGARGVHAAADLPDILKRN